MKIRITKAPPQNGLAIEGDKYKSLSSDGITLLGNSHEKGGTMVSSNGELVEAEAQEPIYTGSDGSNYVFGNVKNPFSKRLFKNEGKQLLEQKGKEEKKMDKANLLIQDNDPQERFQSLTFNAGQVKLDAAQIQTNKLKTELDTLAETQERILSLAQQTNQDPKKLGAQMMKNGGKIKVKIKGLPKADDGKKLNPFMQSLLGDQIVALPWQQTPQQKVQEVAPVQAPQPMPYNPSAPSEYVQNSLVRAANQVGIDPEIMLRLSSQESDFRPGVKGVSTKYGTAHGHVQFLPGTAKEYGLTPAQLKSKKPEDIDAVSIAGAKHLQKLIQKHYGDRYLALAEYNGGQGAINDIKKGTGKDNPTGRDAINYWQSQNEKNPSSNPNLYRNQTLNYITNIMDTPDEEFYGRNGRPSTSQGFRQNYYNGIEGTTPIAPSLGNPPVDTSNDPQTPNTDWTYNNAIPNSQDRFTPIEANNLNQDIGNRANVAAQTPLQAPRRNRLNPLDFLGEMAAIVDRPDYVQGQQFNPVLQTPYRMSFQDQRNANTDTFNALSRNFVNNPEALATLAAQNYQADNQSYGQEFRTNQQIQDRVLNANNQILNQAEMTNLQLADQQYVRQNQAEANTDMNRMNALTSISNKYAQNNLYNNMNEAQFNSENRTAGIMRNMFPNYSYGAQGQEQFTNANPYEFNYGGMGMTPEQVRQQYYAQQAQENLLKKQAKEQANKTSRATFGHKFKK